MVTLSGLGFTSSGKSLPGTVTLPSMVTGLLSGPQIVTNALPASAQTPGCVLMEHIAAAIPQSTALPPRSAISAAACAASSEVVATATLSAFAVIS